MSSHQQTEEDPDRRIFAMAALQGLIARPESSEMLKDVKGLETIGKVAWAAADAMLRMRG